MNHLNRLKAIIALVCAGAVFCVSLLAPSFAYESDTLYNGCRGEEVRQLQQALIDLGYLKGTADGVFGNNTENAVRKFQKKNKLDVDGLAGAKTREMILGQAAGRNTPAPSPSPAPTPAPTGSPLPDPTATPVITNEPDPSGSLFGGNYATIRYGNRGSRVQALQKGLISAGVLGGKADGIFGKSTFNAVKSFQRGNKLSVDGVAGKKTLKALEKVYSGGGSPTQPPSPSPTAAPGPTPSPDPDAEDLNDPISAPDLASLQLLHWFNDVKPSLSGNQRLLIYDPASGLNWTVRILARGRHCDAEPLTKKDTRTMVRAFGGVNTWNQKAVCVQLPDGRWTIGSTHDMPHDSGSIKDNGFNGHLCVHFLRDMDEAKKNDPNYGVSNQETIRKYWKKWTGGEITD